jgi:hypothetical protein
MVAVWTARVNGDTTSTYIIQKMWEEHCVASLITHQSTNGIPAGGACCLQGAANAEQQVTQGAAMPLPS